MKKIILLAFVVSLISGGASLQAGFGTKVKNAAKEIEKKIKEAVNSVLKKKKNSDLNKQDINKEKEEATEQAVLLAVSDDNVAVVATEVVDGNLSENELEEAVEKVVT